MVKIWMVGRDLLYNNKFSWFIFSFAAAEQTLQVTRIGSWACRRTSALRMSHDGTSSALCVSSLLRFRAMTSTNLSEGWRNERVMLGSFKEQDGKSTRDFLPELAPCRLSVLQYHACVYTPIPHTMCLWDYPTNKQKQIICTLCTGSLHPTV